MFVDTSKNYPFLHPFTKQWGAIRAEIGALEQAMFDRHKHSLDGGWKIILLQMLGEVDQDRKARCPITFSLLDQVPNLTFAAVSKLSARSRIHPHKEWIKEDDKMLYSNGNLFRAHLGIEVPADEQACAMRVGTETQSWKPGRFLVFDDSIEHEVWNDTDEDRIVLVFDFLKVGGKILESDQLQSLQKSMIRNHMTPRA